MSVSKDTARKRRFLARIYADPERHAAHKTSEAKRQRDRYAASRELAMVDRSTGRRFRATKAEMAARKARGES